MPSVAALVALAVLCWLSSDGRQAAVPPNGQFDCCVCGRSGATLLWLCPADLVALAIQRRLGGNGRSSLAVAAVITRTELIKVMAILNNKKIGTT